MTEMMKRHLEVLSRVHSNNYYVHLLEGIPSPIQDDEIASFWNVFWARLPDSRTIHRQPFYDICDLAEGIFD